MRIVVLGSGISGLSTAAELLRGRHEVIIVSATPITATTSFLAAAVWFPTAAGPADRVRAWSDTTFEHLAALAAAGAPGVRMCESTALYRDEPAVPAWSRSVRSFRAAGPGELPPGYGFGFRFAVPLVEMPTYLPFLSAQVDAAGARRVRRTVHRLADLADLSPDVVVNCAGLRAAELVGDPDAYPIRGQIVRVTNPGLSVSIRDEAHPLGRAYVHPRAADCVLGGSLEPGEWETAPDPELTRSILRRCRDLAPALAESQVLETLVGLRPGRAEVRLELDTVALPGIPVVHNYGHGGSGITIGYGCALESAALVAAL
ncbi:FAD-binding oxidoreductase [Nocardia amamiensis]|uniref:D-amino-acid oxidase n=1 Tax=Nocardia amamiensis TaxID=404578 RepID=A0ABS0CZ42_9NOCA|nr:FAD-dependent oxidoreductase [Nocardia amamiensis]MBF6301785.1 FAD-binding oxidoreductase [Nocardia amamiensis]